MKLNMAIRELHRSEGSLARDLRTLAARHHVEHEIHYVALDLAVWSENHVRELAAAGEEYELHLDDRSGPLVAVAAHALNAVQTRVSEALGRRPEPALLLLTDLRHLYRKSAGVSLDWELLEQGAQAAKDVELTELAQRCHPETLRQLKWADGMLKILSPQVLTS